MTESDNVQEVAEHSNALQVALNCGGEEDYAKLAPFLERGVPLPNAALVFTSSYWEPEHAEQNRLLMERYIDAGYLRVDDWVVVDAFNALPHYKEPHLVLSRAISARNEVAVEVLLARGALEVEGLSADLATCWEDQDGLLTRDGPAETLEERLRAYVELRFGMEAPQVMARFTEVLMRRRMEGAGAPEGSGARAGRGCRRV